MTSLRILVCVVLLLASAFGTAEPSQMSRPTRPVTSDERLISHVDFNPIVVFARVIQAEPAKDENGTGWKLDIEPISYFKGGLDGDRLDVRIHSREVASQAEYDRYTRPYLDLAKKPTWAGVFFLRYDRGQWYVDPTVQAFTELAPIQAPQSHWTALTDSLGAIIAAASLDSTLKHADLVAIVHADPKHTITMGQTPKPVPLIVDQTLAGGASHAVRIRTLWGYFPEGQHLVCMKKGRDGIYEPLPFTRTVLSKEEKPGRGVVLGDARLNEVKEILARVRPQDATASSKP